MKTPQHLSHRPIVTVDDYDSIEKANGIYTNSDAKALSVGQPQYDDDVFSVKVFRHTGAKWSRQGEDIPIHRALDLAILIIATMHKKQDTTTQTSNLNEHIIAPDRFDELQNYYTDNKDILEPRLKEIKKLVSKLV